MSKKLYKYIGPNILDIAFNRKEYCGLKCSFPKDYNDPYELFLTIDFKENPEILAYYNEVVSEIPQYPTTCFSNSPTVIPMWAHYAHSSKGFVIEVDEERLNEYLDSPSLGDVLYQDEPRSELATTLQYAYMRRKPRDLMFLRQGVQHAAYFTKQTSWSYELERRLIASEDQIEKIHDNMVLYIPQSCITAIISGAQTDDEYKRKGKELCISIGCDYFEMLIGKSTTAPFFVDNDSRSFIFDESNIALSGNSCESCKEPIDKGNINCSWCSITDNDRQNAGSLNTLRMLNEAGILSDYVKGFNDIGK